MLTTRRAMAVGDDGCSLLAFEMVTVIMETELPSSERSQTVLLMTPVTLEPLPHHYEQLAKIVPKQQQQGETAAAQRRT
ncbi:hypothetical protein L6452_18207 [Arctium lappa]|uniref:Uncharacterized protein n=1 Tax=Arctium lappa TaxID=4217 RepID=A0ACB9C5I0_ARCLA|nr:hypothetical protein L6452_18207 [Arctium lappa]